MISLGILPESPRYLLANGDIVGAVKSLVQISLTNNPSTDKRKLIQTLTKALQKSSNRYEDDDDDHVSISVEDSMLNSGDLKITNKDLRQRIVTVCVIDFRVSVSRNSFLFASGQSYVQDHFQEQCNQCSALVSINHLISVSVASSLAIIISYNVIGFLKRRLAMRIFITVLAIAILPFYFQLSNFSLSICFFIVSVINECLMLLRLVYCSEVVPSSVRGFTTNLMFAFGITGSLVWALMATYTMHISYFVTFLFLHFCVLVCLVVVYRYVIETKHMSLN